MYIFYDLNDKFITKKIKRLNYYNYITLTEFDENKIIM